jgi:retinol dehydrogenase 14
MSQIDSMAGRTCLITGATSGIGRATALALATRGARLILVGRRQQLGARLVAQICSQRGTGQAHFLRADLSDQRQVRELAATIATGHPQLHVLVNNAGARFNTYQQTSDGLERTFATNHLGHFLLTALLLENLARADSARVVTVGSGAHHGIPAGGDWYCGPENYDRKLAYGKSKLANIVFAYELARRLSQTSIVSNAVDPGGVATQLGRNNGLFSWCKHLLYYALKRKLVMPWQGAETVVYLAGSEAVRGVTGKYFYRKQEAESSPASHDAEAARKLWSLSLARGQLDESVGPAWRWIQPCQP